jgi:hypothetical protein
MSLVARHITGGIKQLHRGLAKDDSCTVLGKSFKPVNGRRGYEKRQSDAGFIANVDAVFDALNVDIAGLIPGKTIGQVLSFKGGLFVVRRYEEGEITTLFYCEAKNA